MTFACLVSDNNRYLQGEKIINKSKYLNEELFSKSKHHRLTGQARSPAIQTHGGLSIAHAIEKYVSSWITHARMNEREEEREGGEEDPEVVTEWWLEEDALSPVSEARRLRR